MVLFKRIFTENFIKKLFALFILILLFYSIKNMITLVLLTFVFSFLFHKFVNFTYRQVSKVIPIKRKAIILLIYLILFISISYFFYNYIPIIVKQLILIKNQLTDFNLSAYKGILDRNIINLAKESNINSHLSEGGAIILKWIMRVEKLSTDIFLSFILSLFFVLEQDEIIKFGEKIEKSKVAYIYKYYKNLGIKFLSSFGKIMEIQAIISLSNAVLASISLYIIGFDEVLGLGFMLFILGLIPVAGMFIAIIPLIIIAFKIGGITKVIYVLIILLVLHILEAYAIKPKLMSMSVKIPIFFVFVILIFSEHYMGIWGLIIGLPLFVFVLDILEISEL